MLGKKFFLDRMNLLHDYINVKDVGMIANLEAKYNVLEQRLDTITALLQELVAKDTLDTNNASNDYFRNENGLLSYRAPETKARELYGRPRDVR